MYKKIISIMIVMLFLSGCTLDSSVDTDNLRADLEKFEIQEVYFLFFTDQETRVPINFPFKTGDYKFTKAELYQDDQSMGENIRITGNTENRVEILMNAYVPNFNRIHLTLDSGETLRLNTGQYYFEEWSHPINNLQKNEKGHIRTHNSKDAIKDGNIIWESKGLFDNIENSEVRILVPELFKKQLGLKDIEVVVEKEGQLNSHMYRINIPTDYFKDHNYDSVIFDAIWIQEVLKTGEKHFLLKESVPLSLN